MFETHQKAMRTVKVLADYLMLSESHWYWTQDPLMAKKVVESEEYKKVEVGNVIKLLIRSKMLYEAMHEMIKLL